MSQREDATTADIKDKLKKENGKDHLACVINETNSVFVVKVETEEYFFFTDRLFLSVSTSAIFTVLFSHSFAGFHVLIHKTFLSLHSTGGLLPPSLHRAILR